MKLAKLHRSKSQKQQGDNVIQDKACGDEFEVVPATSPYPPPTHGKLDTLHLEHQTTELKRQKFSLVRMFSSSNKNVSSKPSHKTTNLEPIHDAAIHSTHNQPFSPASTAASSTTATMTPNQNVNKKQSKFMKRLKKKTSDLFNFDGPTERISVGDEYAIISVKPKSLSWDVKGDSGGDKSIANNCDSNNVVDTKDTDADSNVQLKRQKFSLVRMFSSSNAHKSKSTHVSGPIVQQQQQQQQQDNIPRSKSTPVVGPYHDDDDDQQPKELKKQRFSLVRPFSSRRNG